VGAASSRPTAVDLFAGAGGLSLGLEQAGFDVVAAVEYDPVHALAHRYNFPQCQVLCRDVRRLQAGDVMTAARVGASRLGRPIPADGGVDLLAGGPSCQGFSSIGQRRDADARNDLLLEFVRLVVEMRPRAFLLENVPGLLEARFDDFRDLAFRRLRAAGYALSGTDHWLDASAFGVPQSRKRVVVTGVLGESAAGEPSPSPGSPLTVRDALDGLPHVEVYEQLLSCDSVPLTDADGARRRSAASPYARWLAGLEPAGDLARPRAWDPAQLTNSLRTVHSPDTLRRFEGTPVGATEPTSRLFRLPLDAPARTLRAGTGRERGAHTSPRPIHPLLPRVITVREAARLHGYPDWFRFSGTNWHGHRQVGNSVPPPLARAAAAALLHALGARPATPRRLVGLGEDWWLTARPAEAGAVLPVVKGELPPQRIRPGSPSAGSVLCSPPSVT